MDTTVANRRVQHFHGQIRRLAEQHKGFDFYPGIENMIGMDPMDLSHVDKRKLEELGMDLGLEEEPPATAVNPGSKKERSANSSPIGQTENHSPPNASQLAYPPSNLSPIPQSPCGATPPYGSMFHHGGYAYSNALPTGYCLQPPGRPPYPVGINGTNNTTTTTF